MKKIPKENKNSREERNRLHRSTTEKVISDKRIKKAIKEFKQFVKNYVFDSPNDN